MINKLRTTLLIATAMAVFALPDKALGIVSSDLGWCHVVLKEYGNNSLDIALTQCTSNKYSGDSTYQVNLSTGTGLITAREC